MQDMFDELEDETKKNVDEYFNSDDWASAKNELESTTEMSSTDADTGQNVNDNEVTENDTSIDPLEIAGRYEGLDSDDTLEISMYTSPEDDEIGNFNYCGNSGVIVAQDGQYILYGDYDMVMNVSRNDDGVIQVTLWTEDGDEKYGDLIMVEHFQS